MANSQVVKQIILSIIDENRGIVRIATLIAIILGNNSRISSSDIEESINELVIAGVIDRDNNFCFRKK